MSQTLQSLVVYFWLVTLCILGHVSHILYLWFLKVANLPIHVKLIRYRIPYTKNKCHDRGAGTRWHFNPSHSPLLWWELDMATIKIFLSEKLIIFGIFRREIFAWLKILNRAQHQIWQVCCFIFILSWTPVSAWIRKTYLTKSFSFFSFQNTSVKTLAQKGLANKWQSIFLCSTPKLSMHTPDFFSVPLPICSAHVTNLAFGGERISHWSSEGELRIPYKSVFKPCVCYSSLPSHENFKIHGTFYSKLPF